MIGLRVQCDADGCGRHFEVPGHELMPVPAVNMGPMVGTAGAPGSEGAVAIMLNGPVVPLPAGWAVGGGDRTREGFEPVRVLCADHASGGG